MDPDQQDGIFEALPGFAANQLEKNDRSTQAIRLYRELVRDYPGTMSAEQAEERLARTVSQD